MKIKIYQIDVDRDDDDVAFASLDETIMRQGESRINSEIYDNPEESLLSKLLLQDADKVIRVCTPNLKCLSYHQSQTKMLTRFGYCSYASPCCRSD